MTTLHTWELTTTTVLALGLFFSCTASAVELDLKPTLTLSGGHIAGIERRPGLGADERFEVLGAGLGVNERFEVLGAKLGAGLGIGLGADLGLELNKDLGADNKLSAAVERGGTYRVAGVCFLTDCLEESFGGGKLDDIEDLTRDASWCEENGYLLTCPGNMGKVANKDCPRDPNYGTCSLDQYCKDKGYGETSATCKKKGANYYVDTSQKCPNGQEFYKKCVINNQQACKDAGYVTSCSSGRMYATSNKCPYDSSYGKCCTAAPSAGCPSNYTVTCTGATSGTDSCGYACKQCCTYNTTASSCSNKCMYTGSNSCVINGTTFYSGCGLSKCGSNESCSSGTCSCNAGYVEYCGLSSTDCAALGYTKTSCPSGGVKCPFDTTKMYCDKCDGSYRYTCDGPGETGGSGPSCDGKYQSCNCDNSDPYDSYFFVRSFVNGACRLTNIRCCGICDSYENCHAGLGHINCSIAEAECKKYGATEMTVYDCNYWEDRPNYVFARAYCKYE